jgi:TonB family protein
MRANRASRQFLNWRRYSFVPAQCVLLLSILLGAGWHAPLVAQETSHRKVVVRVSPEYPETLRIAQIGGLVRLSATVQPNGTVTQVDIRGGNPILAEKAQQAVMKWKYAPSASQTVEEVSLSFSPH